MNSQINYVNWADKLSLGGSILSVSNNISFLADILLVQRLAVQFKTYNDHVFL
jgi:hypothetical protein